MRSYLTNHGADRRSIIHSNIVPIRNARSHPTYSLIRDRRKGLGIELSDFYDDDVRKGQLKVYESWLELLWKDMLDIPVAIEIYAPNSANEFSRFGLRGTANLGKNLMLSVDASYNVRGGQGFTNTVILHDRFL